MLKNKFLFKIPKTKNFTSFIYLPCSKADPDPIKRDKRSGKVYSFLVCFKSNWTLKSQLRPTIPRTKNFTSFIYLPCSKADPDPIKRDERSEVPPVAPPLKLDMPWLEFALLEPCFCCLSENALVLSLEKSRLFLSLFPAPKKRKEKYYAWILWEHKSCFWIPKYNDLNCIGTYIF